MHENELAELEALCKKIAARKPCTAESIFIERMALGTLELVAEVRRLQALPLHPSLLGYHDVEEFYRDEEGTFE